MPRERTRMHSQPTPHSGTIVMVMVGATTPVGITRMRSLTNTHNSRTRMGTDTATTPTGSTRIIAQTVHPERLLTAMVAQNQNLMTTTME